MHAETKEQVLPVEYLGVSFGKTTMRVGVKIKRESLTVSQAEKLFCDRRLWLIVTTCKAGDDPAQQTFDDSFEQKVEGSADVKGFTVRKDELTLGLTYMLEDIDDKTLRLVHHHAGWLTIKQTGAIPVGAVAAEVAA